MTGTAAMNLPPWNSALYHLQPSHVGNWANEIDAAMLRTGNGFSANDVIFWLRNSEGMMFVSGNLHASVRVHTDGTAEVGHMGGKWSDSDAKWIIDRARDRLAEIGIDELQIHGRKGWKRFLKQRGFL